MKTIKQKKMAKGYRKFEILEHGKLRVTSGSYAGSKEEYINLFDIDPSSDRYFQRPIKHIVLSAIFFLASIPLIIQAINNLDIRAIYFDAIFLVPGVIFALLYIDKKIDVTVFRYRNNGNVAFSLWSDNPSKKELSTFTDSVSHEIKSLKINPDLNSEKKLEIYRSGIDFLFSEGILTKDEAVEIYGRAKDFLSKKSKAKLYSIGNMDER